jgi:homogentisate 1,2-dioxygenase
MMERLARGEIPRKPHTVLRAASGQLRYEECLTRAGFDGPYSMLYHQHRPHEASATDARYGWKTSETRLPSELLRRHYRSTELAHGGGTALDTRIPLLMNDDLALGMVFPSLADRVYFSNGDADELFFIQRGSGTLRSAFGDLRFFANDYVCVPRGISHRFLPDSGIEQHWLTLEFFGSLGIPAQYRNPIGQLCMDAPYSHRDFRAPDFIGPLDEGLRELVVKRGGVFYAFRSQVSPLDVVGWDGTVYPWAFSMLDFQPRVGAVHLPPTVHATFAARGVLLCSFVPRPLDFHPDAIPCPYAHSSVDIDEVIFYARGDFTSRRGVGPGSLSLHPAGIAHGPHPGAYEASIGARATDELAVMLDCAHPLKVSAAAGRSEDPGYHGSFSEPASSHSTG